MKSPKNPMMLLLAGITAGALSGQAVAAHHEGPTFVPVDLMACSFKEDKDWDDLEKLNQAFIKWVNKQGEKGYTYWIFTPRYHENNDMDFAWIGGWADGNAMGRGWDAWMASSGDVGEMFAETAECNSSLAASLEVSRVEGPWPESGITWFSRCELQNDASVFDALEAHKKASARMSSMAPPSSSWLFLPALGFGDAEFDYYHVQAWDSTAAIGAGFEAYFNGGGWETEEQKAVNEIEMCHSANLYNFRLMYDGTAE